MCTAIYNNDGILGRTVDRTGSLAEHFVFGGDGFIGGIIRNSYGEIWIDGMNEHGVMAALLNYRREPRAYSPNKRKISPGFLVREIIESCGNVSEAETMLRDVELSHDEPRMYPHFIICGSDGRYIGGRCIVYENGKIYENRIGVLANSPSFPEMCAMYDRVSEGREKILWDHTSESRFLRMAHLRENTPSESIADVYSSLNQLAVAEGYDPRKSYRTVLRNVMSAKDGVYCVAEGCAGCVRYVNLGEKGVFSVEECGILTLS